MGILSYVFEKRHAIAYSIGIIAEIPIALCNADYDFSGDLKIQDADEDQSMPYFASAQEINLFFISAFELEQAPSHLELSKAETFCSDLDYHSPTNSIFHPPSLA